MGPYSVAVGTNNLTFCYLIFGSEPATAVYRLAYQDGFILEMVEIHHIIWIRIFAVGARCFFFEIIHPLA